MATALDPTKQAANVVDVADARARLAVMAADIQAIATFVSQQRETTQEFLNIGLDLDRLKYAMGAIEDLQMFVRTQFPHPDDMD